MVTRKNKIQIEINATDNASKVLRGVASNMQGIGKTITTGIAVGAAVATAAVATFAVTSIQAFSSFEKGMNEVFTLMPDINEDAMTRMTKDVQRFSDRMKILPDEVIPALYQAISAGVPKDNVFDFLEVSQKAAIAGVADLTTAVDGISSAVNAFEAAGLDATQASDQMFTAIRLGKTDFTQLSAGMAGVNSIAAAVGVSFGDVMAAQAAMTAQGKGNAEAFTQMRGLLVELADGGTDVGKIFSETAGVGFTEFIAQGNNMSDAMKVIEQASRDTGIPILEMFGNIRAGQGALALTGDQAGRFADNIAAMGESAGATDAAFEKMDRGISRTMDGIHASARNAFIFIGGMLEPLVLPGLEQMGTFLKIINAALDGGETQSDWLLELPIGLRPLARTLATIAASFRGFFVLLEKGVAPADAFMVILNNVTGINLFPIVEAIDSILKGIQAIIEPIAAWVSENIELESVLLGVAVIIGSFVIPALLGIATAIAAPLALFAGLVLAIQILKNAWETDFLGIRTTVTNFWNETLHPFLIDAQDWFENKMPQAIEDFRLGFDAAVETAINFVREHKAMFVVLGGLAVGFAAGAIAITAFEVAAGVLAGILGTLLSPLVLVSAAIAGIIIASELLYPGGIVQMFKDASKSAKELGVIGLAALNEAAQTIRETLKGLGDGLGEIIEWNRKWLERNDTLLIALGLLSGAIILIIQKTGLVATAQIAWNAAIAIGNTALGIFNPLVAALGVKLGFANTAALGLKATLAAAVLPIGFIAGAILGIVAAIVKFNNAVGAVASSAASVSQEAIASGRRTEQQVRDQVFASAAAEVGDLGARVLLPSLLNSIGLGTPEFDEFAAAGGRVSAGQIVQTHGLSSGREVFIPGVNGEIQNQAQQDDTNGGSQRPVNVTINVQGVPSQAQGQQVAFRMVNALRAQGVQVEDSQT